MEAWLAEDSVWMQRAVEEAPLTTGFSAEMVRWSLVDLMRRMTSRSLIALVEAELGAVEPFQAPRNRGAEPCARAANPPALVFHVLAGTVPPVGIETIVLSLLARGPALIKTATEEPTISRLFLESMREIAPELARHVAVCTWRGGNAELDQTACLHASVVVAYGGDEAVNALMSHCRFPTRFYGYGHRVSFAIVGPAADTDAELALDQVAQDLALDAAAYDQRGCMSPHCVFVATDAAWTPEQVARAIADKGFPAVGERLPRGRLATETAAAIAQTRGVSEFTAQVFESQDALVILQPNATFVPSPGGRTLHVIPYRDEAELLASVAPLAGSISVVGIRYDSRTRDNLIAQLGRLGARRFCRLGRMQRPIWLRDHDGRPRLGDWVDWSDVEPLY